MIKSYPKNISTNAQETDVRVHNQSSIEATVDRLTSKSSMHLIHLPPLGARCFPFIPREDDKIMTQKLELAIILESALSCLDFVMDFSQFLSRKESRLSERKCMERKGHVRVITLMRNSRNIRATSERRQRAESSTMTRVLHAKRDITLRGTGHLAGTMPS